MVRSISVINLSVSVSVLLVYITRSLTERLLSIASRGRRLKATWDI